MGFSVGGYVIGGMCLSLGNNSKCYECFFIKFSANVDNDTGNKW